MPLDLFTMNVEGDEYHLSEIPNIDDFIQNRLIVFDIETRDPGIEKKGPGNYRQSLDNYIIGIAAAVADREWYWPFAHASGPNLNYRNVIKFLQDVAKRTKNTKTIIGAHNGPYDFSWMKHPYDIDFGKDHIFRDSMIGAALLDEYDSLSLDHVGEKYLGVKKDEKYMRGNADLYEISPKSIKSNMWQMHARYVAPYAMQDARLTYDLIVDMEKRIENADLMAVYEMENSLLPMGVDMRHQGLRINVNGLDELSDKLDKQIETVSRNIERLVGFDVNTGSNSHMMQAFDRMGIKYDYTENKIKRNGTFTKEKLALYRKSRCPDTAAEQFIDFIFETKKYQQYKNLYITSLTEDYLIEDHVHPSINMTKTEKYSAGRSGDDTSGTISGRSSMVRPNIQQIPNPSKDKTGIGAAIRSLFLPEDGQVWAALDYSQQEPRISVHYSCLNNLNGAEEARSYYDDPNADFYKILASMAKIERSYAKQIFLGLSYSMGGVKLCKELQLPTIIKKYPKRDKRTGRPLYDDYGKPIVISKPAPGEEGEQLFQLFHERVPFIKELTQLCKTRAEEQGFIRTLSGRKANFPFFEPRDYDLKMKVGKEGYRRSYEQAIALWGHDVVRADTRKATNRLIQGSAADMTKYAMLAVYRAGYLPLTTVHDELGFSVSSYEEVKKLKELMLYCVDLLVPMKVDIDIGPSWGQSVRTKEEEEMSDFDYCNMRLNKFLL